MTCDLDPMLSYPPETTYLLIRTPDGEVHACTVSKDQCLYLGEGSTVALKTTNREEWSQEAGRLGVECEHGGHHEHS